MAPGILGIQILGILFGIFMMYYTFLQHKRRELNSKEYNFWLILWSLFIIFAIFPWVLDPITKSLNIARTMDLFIVVGFMFLIGLGFYTHTIVRKNEKRIEEIVRKIAFKK